MAAAPLLFCARCRRRVNAGLLLAVFELSVDFFIGSDHLQQRASSHSHGNVMCGCGGVACLCRNIGGCIWCLGRAVVAGGYLIPPEEQYASYAAALERVGCAVRLYADGGTARATCRQAPKPSSHRRTSSRERPACHRPRRSCCWDIAEEQRRAPSPQRLVAAMAAAAASGSSGSRGAWPRSCSSTRWTRPGPTRRQRSPQVEARAGVARTQAESRAEASLVWRESRMY